MECECITVITTFVGLLIALITIYIGLKQYKNENRFKKAAQFFELRRRFKENNDFTMIREKVMNESRIDDITVIKVYDYVGFFEELQIAINSNFIDEEMVYYLFGHYIIDFGESEFSKFIEDVNLWTLYNKLLERMKEIDTKDIDYNNLKF